MDPAVELWTRISERFGSAVDPECAGPASDGIGGMMPEFLRRNPEPLLEKQDRAGLVIAEKEHILTRAFLEPGRIVDRVRELEVFERGAVVFSFLLHPEVLRESCFIPPTHVTDDRELIINLALASSRCWIRLDCHPALLEVEERGNQDNRWGLALMSGSIAAETRAERLTQLYMGMVYGIGNLRSWDETYLAMKKGLREHGKFQPKAYGQDATRIDNHADAGRWAQVIERDAGFTRTVHVDEDGRIGVGWTNAKDGFDRLFGRWTPENAEPVHEGFEQTDTGDGILQQPREADVHQRPDVYLARSEAQEATAGLGLRTDLFEDYLRVIDELLDDDPEVALTLTAELVRLVRLVASQGDPGLRGAVLHAWSRDQQHRGGWSRASCARAVGVSPATVKRREAPARSLLIEAGLVRAA